MEHLQHGMRKKREKHYNETRSIVAVSLLLLGFCFIFSLVFLWPQVLSSSIFNSRLAFHIVIDADDSWTCDSDFKSFVIDEPPTNINLISFYFFNVTNTQSVVARGYKPALVETGPFGYQRYTYKYDISFNEEVSTQISYKEYSVVKAFPNSSACQEIFYRMDRDHPPIGESYCQGSICSCKSDEEVITITNPNFLQVAWEETSQEFMATLSSEIFATVRKMLLTDFIVATKAHLVKSAYREIYDFRYMMQVGEILNTAFHNISALYGSNVTYALVSNTTLSHLIPSSCGLEVYGISTCPWSATSAIKFIKQKLGARREYRALYQNGTFPPYSIFLDPTNNMSYLNVKYGLPAWICISYYLGYTSLSQLTMIKTSELIDIYNNFVNAIALEYYGSLEIHGVRRTKIIVESVAYYLTQDILSTYATQVTNMVYREWNNTYTPKVCAPYGRTCTWQWGYVTQKLNINNVAISNSMIYSLIDPSSSLSTNPNNLFWQGNSARIYNTYKYCTNIYYTNATMPSCDVTGLGIAKDDALINFPAGLFGIDYNIDQLNRSAAIAKFKQAPKDVKWKYINLGCSLSRLQYEVYPALDSFHDEYTINYLNKYKDTRLLHNFTIDNWNDIGYAQWGGGFITQALIGVRTIYQVTRNGMWYFGDYEYISEYLEYSTHAITGGFPESLIYTVPEAMALLDTLASDSLSAKEFRRVLIFKHMTFIGNGKHFINGVGSAGDYAYTNENNLADFSCGEPFSFQCNTLDIFYNSSVQYCEEVNEIFQACLDQIHASNPWITNCNVFETTLTSPQSLSSVQCDASGVNDHPHPYRRGRGNIVVAMALDMTQNLVLTNGLWCESYTTCKFDLSGMFITTSIRKYLFEGFYDRSVLKYLNMKHNSQNISFQCTNNPYLACGIQNYACDDDGLMILLPNGSNFTLSYQSTPKDKYFAPFFEISSAGDLVWRYSMDPEEARNASLFVGMNNVIRVRNPIWAAYPGWTHNDTTFLKYYQCLKRVYMGPPSLFQSCMHTIDTGLRHLSKTKAIVRAYGNATVLFSNTTAQVKGFPYFQYEPHLWKGFESYPYLYQAKSIGDDYGNTQILSLFDRLHTVTMDLSQAEIASSGQSFSLRFPLQKTASSSENSDDPRARVRRFGASKATWDELGDLSAPKDSLGMGYPVPKGMSSLQSLAGYPLFIGTPHHYGNQKWGGIEYLQFTGLQPREESQLTYVDYEPVSGAGLRSAIRQQVSKRGLLWLFENSYLKVIFLRLYGRYVII